MMGGDLATEVLQLFGIGSCSVKIIGRRNPYSQVNFCDVIIINLSYYHYHHVLLFFVITVSRVVLFIVILAMH